MAEDEKQTSAIQPGKPKRTWHKNWTPKDFALFLMSENMKYVLPGTSNETIMEELKGKLHCGIGKVTWLRNHREFQKTVEETYNQRIESKFSAETMFFCYLAHCFERNMDSEKPSEKLIDVLGHLSGKYTPRTSKPKKGEKLSRVQMAQYIHLKEQIEAKKKERQESVKDDDKGGKKDA